MYGYIRLNWAVDDIFINTKINNNFNQNRAIFSSAEDNNKASSVCFRILLLSPIQYWFVGHSRMALFIVIVYSFVLYYLYIRVCVCVCRLFLS